MNWIRTEEGTKQKKLNFKLDLSKRGKPQKCIADNKSGGRNWKSKWLKKFKKDQCLKSIMSIMTTEEWTNQALVSEFLASNSQPSVSGNHALISELSACSIQHYTTVFVFWPPTTNVVITTGVKGNPPTQVTISTAAQAYPETNVKLQSILENWHAPSAFDEGSCVVSSEMPNIHISKVILAQISDVEASSDDPRTELDCHSNIVIIGSNSFVL